MRIRKKPWAQREMSECAFFEKNPKEWRGKWQEKFETQKPLHLEIGCGKGVSTAKMVADQRDTNFVVLDVITDILGSARRNIVEAFAGDPIENVWLTRYDVQYINQIFAPEDGFERMYIHFCNPWTQRSKHHKRRLTHPRQLEQYRAFLKENAEIWFKTDDDLLFADSVEYFKESGFTITYLTMDLHQSGFAPNYVSEHEAKYMAEGVPIKFLIARMDPIREELKEE